MKKYLYIIFGLSAAAVLFTACPQNIDENKKSKPVEEIGEAHPSLKGTFWISPKITCSFKEDVNICEFMFLRGSSPLKDIPAVYTVNEADNSISFNFDPFIKYCNNFNEQTFFENIKESIKEEIESSEEQLKEPGLPDEVKEKIKQHIKKLKEFIDKPIDINLFIEMQKYIINSILEQINEALATPGLPPEEKEEMQRQKAELETNLEMLKNPDNIKEEIKNTIERVKKFPQFIKTANPAQGKFNTAVGEAATFTIKNIFIDLKEDFTPEYAENIQLTKGIPGPPGPQPPTPPGP